MSFNLRAETFGAEARYGEGRSITVMNAVVIETGEST